MQKHVNLVDLVKSFPTNIYLQNLASIQPRTSFVKFARSPRTDPPGCLEIAKIAAAKWTEIDLRGIWNLRRRTRRRRGPKVEVVSCRLSAHIECPWHQLIELSKKEQSVLFVMNTWYYSNCSRRSSHGLNWLPQVRKLQRLISVF